MKNFVLIVGALVCLFSCEKVTKQEETKDPVSEYLPISVGNYWVYQIYAIDSSGNEYQTNTFDSTIISNDTLINGKKYFRFDYFEYNTINTYPIDTIYCRDSLKYLINSKGQLLFSEDNFTDTLYRKTFLFNNDTLYTMTCKMEKIDQEFSVPVGIFNNLLNSKGTVISNPKYTTIKNPRYTNKYYAKEIGVIFQSQILIMGGGFREKKLVRYNINK
jgi:hypothetical protein